MKKLFLMLGLACLFMVSCGNNNKTEEQNTNDTIVAQDQTNTDADAKKDECPMHALKEQFVPQFENWANLDEAAKEALVAEAAQKFNEMDADLKAKMDEKGEECCKDMPEEMKAKCEEMQKAWAEFETLDLEGKKDLIMKRLQDCGGDKPCCNHGEEAPAETPAV